MHVISQKRIKEAKINFPETAHALDGWYRVMRKNQFNNFSELKNFFRSVDKVGAFTVFDIGGNKLRLIANIHFNRQRIYIRYILSHKDYERGHWKNRGKIYGTYIH